MTKIDKIIRIQSLILIVSVFVILLYEIFAGKILLSQSFSIGPLNIRYYGLCMVVAVIAGYVLAKKREAKYNIDSKVGDNIIFWTTFAGFIGARLYHVASSFDYYRIHPVEIFQVWHGGLSIYGAVMGGLIALFILGKILNLKSSILNLLDWLTPSIVLGQIIGRFGNMFNYELFGYPTNLPWKMFVPEQFRPTQYVNDQFYHPLFLYEAIVSGVILFLLLKVLKPKAPGLLFFWYVLLYNIARFCLEFLRIDSVFIGSIRQNALVSAALACTALGVILFNYKHGPRSISQIR